MRCQSYGRGANYRTNDTEYHGLGKIQCNEQKHFDVLFVNSTGRGRDYLQ